MEKIELSTKVLPDGRTIVYTTTPGAVLYSEYEPSPYGFTDVVNRAWIEAADAVGRQYTRREIERGWPLEMEPHRLANLQYPQDSTGQTYINTALLSACKTAQLRCTTYEHHDYALLPNGGRKLIEVWTDYAITAHTFAAWLARQGEEPSAHIAAWFKAVGVAPAATAQPPAPTAPPVVADSPPGGVSWTLIKPQRFQGYGKPLHDLLKAAHIDGQPCPTARDVLDTWRDKMPPEVMEVMTDGLKYYDAKGEAKPADLNAIRKAIGRMTR